MKRIENAISITDLETGVETLEGITIIESDDDLDAIFADLAAEMGVSLED